jgi:hypothetical protein
MRHGAYSEALTVPRGGEWVAGLVRAHHGGLVEDLGGGAELIEAQRRVLRFGMICQLSHQRSPWT